MSEIVLEINNISKVFTGEKRAALKNIKADIKASKITALAGPDGAGKTTLIRLITGLMPLSEGEISICGINAHAKSAELYNLIGYMPQKFGLYEDLTVIENLSLYADLREVSEDKREEKFTRLLKFTSLENFKDRLAANLSGGMKQKLGLACALLAEPRLLLLDEPSVGVDPISRKELWLMVKELLAEGMAVIWSTSYLDEAEKCDDVILLNEGEMIFNGHPKEMLAKVTGRTFLLKSLKAEEKRQILLSALKEKSVIDGVIQGASLRFVLKEENTSSFKYGKELVKTQACFEDAFIDILGGGPGGESKIAEQLKAKPRSSEPIIVADNLTKYFNEFRAVHNNSFEIQAGEVFGLLGPNGAGKSTTFKMMCGLLKPSSGEAYISGTSLKKDPSKARSKLGYMAQKFSLYNNLTPKQNLDFFAGLYGLSGKLKQEKIEMMVEIFELKQFLKSNAGALPLGFKQRLALACAVIHEPDVLFLDEPTSGVDPLTRREFWTHINSMVEKGITIMVTTHFMDEAEYCDRIGLIYKGESIATGSPDELKTKVKSSDLTDPSLEEAFIELVQRSEL